MNDVWMTAAELAGTPGLPSTERRVRARAQRENWPSRRRERGKGCEYAISCLPSRSLAALMLKKTAPVAPAPGGNQALRLAAIEAAAESYDRLPPGIRKTAEFRARALRAVQALVDNGASLTDSQSQVIEQLHSEDASISLVSLWRWRKKVKGVPAHLWLPALAPAWKGRTKTAECSPEAWEAFKADYLRLEQPTAAACYQRVTRLADARGWTLPSQKTLMRRIEREFDAATIAYAREGEEALRRLGPSQERDRSHLLALDAVNADGHKFDVFVKLPDGKIIRPLMVAWQDLASGKILGWRIGQTESSDLVRLSLADVVRSFGIPREAYLDNGRAFASKFLTGGTATRFRFKVREEDPVGVMTGLGIDVHWTTPYHGQAKPIERAFGDLCEHIAKHPQLVGCYTGNSPSAKPENYGSRAVPITEFEQLVAREIAAHNARPGRRAANCQGRSFDATFGEGYAQTRVRKASDSQLRTLLLCSEAVTVSAYNGQVTLGWNHYWSEVTAQQQGKKVLVRFDPERLTDAVQIYALDGRYLGEAACTRARFDSTEAAREHARAKKQFKRATKAQLEAGLAMTAAEMADQLAALEPTAAELPEAQVIEPIFPAPKPRPAVEDDGEISAEEQQFNDFIGAKVAQLNSKRW